MELPEVLTHLPSSRDSALGFDLEAPLERTSQPLRQARGFLAAATGAPDPRLLPMAAMGRAYRSAMERIAKDGPIPVDPRGHVRLREALATMLASMRGLSVPPEELLVSRGSQMALFLVAQALIRPGDRVGVEALGQRRSWEAFERSGAQLVPLTVDAEGVSPEAIEAALTLGPLRAIFVTPQHQYPTTVTLSESRRLRLLALAKTHRMAIVEHDTDAEFRTGGPCLPLACADNAGTVIFIGTLSKVFSPSIRLGFVHGPRALIDRLAGLRSPIDHQGDLALELAMAMLMEEGELQRHVHRMRGSLSRRRDGLAGALRHHLGDAITFKVPSGGMAFWICAANGINVDDWAARALAQGVAFRPAREFNFHRETLPCLRLVFTSLRDREVQEVALRMSLSLKG